MVKLHRFQVISILASGSGHNLKLHIHFPLTFYIWRAPSYWYYKVAYTCLSMVSKAFTLSSLPGTKATPIQFSTAIKIIIIEKLKSCRTGLAIYRGSISYHITLLIINTLKSRHRHTDADMHTHTYTHTDMWTKSISGNQAHPSLQPYLKKLYT